MATRSPPAETKRGIVNMRMLPDLRSKLDAAAAENGRTLAGEIEARLASTFDDPLAKAFRTSAAAYVRNNERSVGAFLGAIAETFQKIDEASKKKSLSELDTRIAMRAAIDRLKFYYLWIGEASSPYPDGYKRKSRTHAVEMPPGAMGHNLASSIAEWNLAWNDEPVPSDTAEGRVANHWSGDGSTIEVQSEIGSDAAASIDEEIKSGLSLDEIMAKRGLKWEEPENLDKYEEDGR